MNNREYTSDTGYDSEALAQEAAATRAYAICRDFSVNDGLLPGQRRGQAGVTQGLPVAIGTGRRSRNITQQYETSAYHDVAMFADAGSRGSSPRSSGSDLDTASRRSSKSSSSGTYYMCVCQRAAVRSAYERCGYCAHEAGQRWY